MRTIALTTLLVLTMTGCYGLPPATESAVRDAIAANAGNAKDKGLSAPAREIALDNHDVLHQILHGAGIADLPSSVRARMDARTAASGK